MTGTDDVLGSGLVRSVLQPIVDLDTGEVVAYEALARGPEGDALERPDALFSAARTPCRWRSCRSCSPRSSSST
jgi:EAL domain-containing protein (putative c-di-GMP-specific phosphodiesterase class I)